MKNTIKKIAKKVLKKDKQIITGSYDEFNFPKALQELVKDNNSLTAKRATAGKRNDREEFSPEIKKITDAFNYFNNTVHEYEDESVKNIGEYDNLHSGTPMKTKPYQGCLNALKFLEFNKSLYCYPATVGGTQDRQAFVDYLIREGFKKEADSKYDGLSINNVAYTCSTTQGFSMILKLIAKKEDVIILTGPNYGLFAIEPERINARVKILNLKEEDNFRVNPTELNELINKTNEELKEKFKNKLDYIPKVVAFLNMNPHNPIGTVMTKKDIKLIEKIAQTCQDNGVFVIDDLIYRDLSFDQDNLAFPMASIPKYFNNTISLFGISKAFGLASFRAGAIVAPIPIIKGLSSLIFQHMDSTPILQVKVMSAAFNGTNHRYKSIKKFFDPIIEEYKYRLQLLIALVDGIDAIKDEKLKKRINLDLKIYCNESEYLSIIKGIENISIRKNSMPESGFFAILDFTKLKGKKTKDYIIDSEYNLLKYLYSKTKIKYIMGISMSWPYEEEIVGRVNFALEKEHLIKNMIKMNKAIKELDNE